jgi:transcriptional regulator with XRE-family HTH domain
MGPDGAMTRHRLNPARLRAEILKRGIDGQTFARHAGISAATLSHVVNGRSANPQTLVAIVSTLARIPVVDGLDEFLEEMPKPENSAYSPSAGLVRVAVGPGQE